LLLNTLTAKELSNYDNQKKKTIITTHREKHTNTRTERHTQVSTVQRYYSNRNRK